MPDSTEQDLPGFAESMAPGEAFGKEAPSQDYGSKMQSIPEKYQRLWKDICTKIQTADLFARIEEVKRSADGGFYWRNIFDAKTRFLRGKLADGSWLEPFDPHTWGGAYVEGSAWQYRFSVPYDPQGLMEALGGRTAFLGLLEDRLGLRGGQEIRDRRRRC